VKLGDGSNLRVADLDGDKVYEWILWQWRGFDRRYGFGFIGGQSAEVYRLVSEKLIKLWPPNGWAAQLDETGDIGQVMNRLYDLDDDEKPDLITATNIRGKLNLVFPSISSMKRISDGLQMLIFLQNMH
jgi:hypothetical protein